MAEGSLTSASWTMPYCGATLRLWRRWMIVEVIEEKIAALAVEERRARLLMAMTSVGYFTAMLILTEVGDISRFRGDKAFASWMGLAPSVHQSGERTRIGGVARAGLSRYWSKMVLNPYSPLQSINGPY